MKYLLMFLLLFTATVRFPMKGTYTYKNVETFTTGNYYYRLVFRNQKTVYVPIFWTIIEEQ